MSRISQRSSSRPISAQSNRAERSGSAPMRWSLLAAGGALAVLTLAYLDGGEEPIRPIVERVELPEIEGGAQ